MEFAANFTAIDFETASRRPDSACQLAAVIVRDGRIVDQAKWLIRPDPFYFSPANIQIHGITPQDVSEEPSFGALWPQIAETLGDDCLVAHNASFDLGVMLACMRRHDIVIPELHFTCTRAIARRTWPHHRRYGLKPLSNWLGIRFRHHDALEDSIACAKILLAAGNDREADSLPDLEKRLKLRRGKAGPWGQTSPSGRSRRRASKGVQQSTAGSLPFLFPDQTGSVATPTANYQVERGESFAVDLQRLMIRAEFIRPLSGKRIVFSGRLRWISREEAEALATRLGANCQPSVNESTDFVVMGSDKASPRDATEEESSPADRAAALGGAGKSIEIVAEEDFLGMVTSPGTTDRPPK